MKLQSLTINSPFRNLEGIVIQFNEDVNSFVFIGNNGSGKSSILEAISSIFYTIYYKTEVDFEFGFCIRYKIDTNAVTLSYDFAEKSLQIKVNDIDCDWNTLKNRYLPSRVICNYSGEETRINEYYYKPAYEKYIKSLKDGDTIPSLDLIMVDKDFWKIIFMIMLSCRHQFNSFNDFFTNTIHLEDPDEIDLDIDEKGLEKWKTNPASYYIRQILFYKNIYSLLTIDAINPEGYHTPLELFKYWVGIKPLIKSLRITYDGGIDSTYLSEGEKKLMVILFILEALADENSLVLLDEPDSHIHVARKGELVEYLNQTDNRENLVTSHSPTLTQKFENKAIKMLDRTSAGKASIVAMEKQEIVAKLTNNIWTIQEQQIFLTSNEDIILVEGWTDEVYLQKALEYHQSLDKFKDLSFSCLPCNGAAGVKLLNGRFQPKEGQKIIALFDNDNAGWNAINELFHRKNEDRFSSRNFKTARKTENIWVAPYPPRNTKNGVFNIEDYFPRQVFLKFILKFKTLDEIVTKDKFKQKLAGACKDGRINGKDYRYFEKVFKLLEDIKRADVEKKEIVQ